ncbi:MAG: hypothetical protein ACOYXU_12540 [Nitrospirota bacterium]
MSLRWLRRIGVHLVTVLVGLSTAGAAVDAKLGLPTPITTGLADYAFQGADAAVKAWAKGSAREGSPETSIQVNYLKHVEAMYGKFQSYHLVQVHALSPLTLIVYLTINYEKGPLFARFLSYRIRNDWVLPEFSFDTKPEAIFPPELLAD